MTPNRFTYLDGIRGIAAILVLTRHTASFWNLTFYRSYLAVDLFFMLSGFVIAFAYDGKLQDGRMSISEFFLVRIIRLYPVFLLSVAVGALAIVVRPMLASEFNVDSAGRILMLTSTTALFIPGLLFGGSTGRAHETGLFPLNPPYWSLFFELIANLLYAVLRPMLTHYVLPMIVAISGLILTAGAVMHGSLDIGFSAGLASSAVGLVRAVFGFFLGLLLYRHHSFLLGYLNRHLTPWLAIATVVLLLMSPSAGKANAVIDMLIVGLMFPTCVLIASKNLPSRIASVLLALGSASYPIYVLHVPIGELIATFLNGTEQRYAPFSGLLLVGLLIALSIWIEKKFDIPTRRWLSKKLLSRFRRTPAIPVVLKPKSPSV